MSKAEVKPESRVEDRVTYLLNRRNKLYRMLIAPLVIDIAMSFGSIPLLPFGGTIAEEVIEYFISTYFSRNNEDVELSNTDKLFGLLPIPGVTAFNVRCFREIYSINQELKTLR